MTVLSSSSFSALVAEKKIGKDELFLSTGTANVTQPAFWRVRTARWLLSGKDDPPLGSGVANSVIVKFVMPSLMVTPV